MLQFLCRLARHWPQLTHLRLDRVNLIPPLNPPDHLPGLSSLAQLDSVHIDNFGNSVALKLVLGSLPSTITALTLNDYELYTSSDIVEALADDLTRRGTSLRELAPSMAEPTKTLISSQTSTAGCTPRSCRS